MNGPVSCIQRSKKQKQEKTIGHFTPISDLSNVLSVVTNHSGHSLLGENHLINQFVRIQNQDYETLALTIVWPNASGTQSPKHARSYPKPDVCAPLSLVGLQNY